MISKLSYIGTFYLHNSGAHLVDDGVHGDLGRFDDWLGENGEVGVACTEGGSSSGIEVESGRGACDMNGGDGDEYVELSTEELVEEAMRRVDFGGEVKFELMPGEMKEDLFVGQFMEGGVDVCGKEISSLQKNTTSISEVPNFTIKFLPHVFLILSHGRLQGYKLKSITYKVSYSFSSTK